MPVKITITDIKDTPWQIQARKRHCLAEQTSPGHADQWEPVSVEHPDKTVITRVHSQAVDELHVYRPYHYQTLGLATAALERYLESEGNLPNVIGRMCTGDYRRLLDYCEVRIVQVGPACVTVTQVPVPAADPRALGVFRHPFRGGESSCAECGLTADNQVHH